MRVSTYFRDVKEMPQIEQEALKRCTGRVLDIGAGAGSHALALQAAGTDVTALDISPGSAEVMRARGVRQVICGDIFRFRPERAYDTLLLLMNGIGLCGDLDGLRRFLDIAAGLLQPQGQLLFDSSDVAYLYEDGVPESGAYYGTVQCRYEYREQFTSWFSWLYIDRDQLKLIAAEQGWETEILAEDDSDQYLARLVRPA